MTLRPRLGQGAVMCGVQVGSWEPQFYNVPRSAAQALCTQHGTLWQSKGHRGREGLRCRFLTVMLIYCQYEVAVKHA